MYTTKRVKVDKKPIPLKLAHGVGIVRNPLTETITATIVALNITEMALVQSISTTKYRDSY